MKNKSKVILSVIGFIISIFLLITSTFLAEYEVIPPVSAIIFIIISVVLVCITIFHLSKIDYKTGVYECRKCGHTFKPTYKAYIMGAHTIKTRHLKCPKCNKKSWCFRNTVKEGEIL